MLPRVVRSAGYRAAGARALYSGTPLTVKHPAAGEAGAFDKSYQGKVNVTKLDSGLTVATIDARGPVATVGLFVGAGTRQESASTAGASLFLTRLATLSTPNRSRVRLAVNVENTHGFAVVRGRESTSVSAQVLRHEAHDLAGLVLDVARPSVQEYEVREVAPAVQRDAAAAQRNPAVGLIDALHAAAYRHVGLGRPLFPEHVHADQASVVRYLHSNWKPHRAVLTATNVDHEALVKFVSGQAAFKNAVDGLEEEVINIPSRFSGGDDVRVAGGDTYVALAFEGVGSVAKTAAAQQVLGRLLRTKVVGALRRNGTVADGCAGSYEYSDSGLVALYVRADRARGLAAVDALVSSLRGISFSQDEVEAAKAAVATAAALRSESNLLADIPQLPHSVVAADVLAVSAADVQALAARVLKSNVALVARGQVEGIPASHEVRAALS